MKLFNKYYVLIFIKHVSSLIIRNIAACYFDTG